MSVANLPSMPAVEDSNRLTVLSMMSFNEAQSIHILMNLKYSSWLETTTRLRRWLEERYTNSAHVGEWFQLYSDCVWDKAERLLSGVFQHPLLHYPRDRAIGIPVWSIPHDPALDGSSEAELGSDEG